MNRFILLSFLLACVGTETGNPPLQPELDETLVFIEGNAGASRIGGLDDAVFPAGTDVQVTDLSSGEITHVPSDERGAFEVTLPGNAFRVQAVSGRLRSQLVDASALADVQSGICRPRVQSNFVRIEGPEGEESTLQVRVDSSCGGVVQAEFLRADQGLRVDGSVFASSLTATLRFDGRPGEVEDTLVFSEGADRVFVTVVAESCGEDCLP